MSFFELSISENAYEDLNIDDLLSKWGEFDDIVPVSFSERFVELSKNQSCVEFIDSCRILSIICSMYVRIEPNSRVPVLGPKWTCDGMSSGDPSNLLDKDVDVLLKWVEKAKSYTLRARIFHIKALRTQHHDDAKLCAVEYMYLADEILNKNSENHRAYINALLCALCFSKAARDMAVDIHDQVLGKLFAFLRRTSPNDIGGMYSSAQEIMMSIKEFDSLESLIELNDSKNVDTISYQNQQALLYLNADLSKSLGKKDKEQEYLRQVVDSYMAEVDSHLKQENPSYLLLVSLMRRAIYTANKAFVDREKLKSLNEKLQDFTVLMGRNIGGIESTVTVPAEEVEKHHLSMRESISGKTLSEALISLSLWVTCTDLSKQEKNTNVLMDECMAISVNEVGQHWGGDSLKPSQRMFVESSRQINAYFTLVPAINIFREEHSPSIYELAKICCENVLVPDDQGFTCAKAIYYGFKDDFSTSAFLYIPVLEGILRNVLVLRGEPVRYFDVQRNKDVDITLASILSKPQVVKFLGGYHFDVEDMLTDKNDHNLRGILLHGLGSKNDMDPYLIFLWAIFLKVVCTGHYFYLDALKRQAT